MACIHHEDTISIHQSGFESCCSPRGRYTSSTSPLIVLTIGSQASLAAASDPLISLSRIPHMVFWLWLHVLALDFSNQTLDPEEDRRNKPERPIPAGRISLRTAVILRWLMPLVCFAWSANYSKELLYSSILNCVFVFIYDEMGYADGHWLGRQVLNSVLHVSFELGATFLAGQSSCSLEIPSYSF